VAAHSAAGDQGEKHCQGLVGPDPIKNGGCLNSLNDLCTIVRQLIDEHLRQFPLKLEWRFLVYKRLLDKDIDSRQIGPPRL
jgi:hypothetical protein